MGKLFLILAKLRHLFLVSLFISILGYSIIIENNYQKNKEEIRDAIVIDYHYLKRLDTLFDNDAVKQKDFLPKRFVKITGRVSSIRDRYTLITLGFNNKYSVHIVVRSKDNEYNLEIVPAHIKGRKNVNFLLEDDIITVIGKLDYEYSSFKVKVKRKDKIIVHDS